MERRDFFKKMGLFAAMFGIGGKLKAQDAQPAEKKADEAPKKTDTKLIFLGTAHGAVTPTRFHSATLLQVGGKNYLIDAGDAVSGQLTKNGFFHAAYLIFKFNGQVPDFQNLRGSLKLY